MTEMMGSALLRRHIGRKFAALRTKAGLTQDQVAKELDRGRGTISRMEDGDERVRFRALEVRALLELYEADDNERDLLLALTAETRNGRKKSWWHDYTETALPEWFGLYVSLEDAAETIRKYESELIPGLLQTRQYARQVIGTPKGPDERDEDVEREVQVRLDRQSVLTRPRAPRLEIVLNEAVIRRSIGGPAAMAEQVEHVLAMTQRGNVSVRIVPFAVGIHAGASVSPFSLLDFPKGPGDEILEPPLVYMDNLTGAMYLNKPNEVAMYRLVWQDLQDRALSDEQSQKLLREVLKGFRDD